MCANMDRNETREGREYILIVQAVFACATEHIAMKIASRIHRATSMRYVARHYSRNWDKINQTNAIREAGTDTYRDKTDKNIYTIVCECC
jgi:hypothetical protein